MALAAVHSSHEVAALTIPSDPAERLALARKAWADLKMAEADLQRIENGLRSEFLAGRNACRADQFAAWTRKGNAEKLLVACLEFGQ